MVQGPAVYYIKVYIINTININKKCSEEMCWGPRPLWTLIAKEEVKTLPGFLNKIVKYPH